MIIEENLTNITIVICYKEQVSNYGLCALICDQMAFDRQILLICA